ncbi:hypothetical protein [Streptomyces sp. NBC_00353]|uniref:hypothetical protein n=1 Tax=unclassified Streptomyces TaxID=2593676 RepID=UPI002E272D87
MIVVMNRVPASLTPLSEWLAEVADDVALVTSLQAADGYRDGFPTLIEVDDYPNSDGVDEALDGLCRSNDVTRIVHVTEEDMAG